MGVALGSFPSFRGQNPPVVRGGSVARRTLAAAILALLVFLIPEHARAAAAIGTLNIANTATPPPLDPKADPAAWKDATAVTLNWDVQHQRASSELTTVHVSTDQTYLYARFDAKQREALMAQQHANDIGDGTDDEVWVDLWPNGASGFYYQFAATSNGTHFQYSSENTAYQPTWESIGTSYDGGFTVTMKIPLKIMRAAGSTAGWKVQFVRIIRSTGERQIWSYGAAQTNGDDVNYAGTLNGLVAASASKAQPRVGVYGLGALGAANQGLSTSRVGADISVPITSTASFYATLHPDFSNVEIDQATISPTAFARYYTEVRPFFTQGASYYDQFDCDACPGINQLYTPNIPTPRDGYAVEGKQGQFSFAGFDSLGVGRTDAAQAFAYTTKNNLWSFTSQRVAADCNLPNTEDCQFDLPSVHDDVLTDGIHFSDSKHIDAYFDYGNDSGSNVLQANQAQRYDGGGFWYTNTFGAAFSMRKVGYYYNPADGLVQHPDISGYAAYMGKIFLMSSHSEINAINVTTFLDRYHNAEGLLDQSDTNAEIDVLTRSRIDANVAVGSSYLLANNCVDALGTTITVTPSNFGQYAGCQVFTPVSQNGVGLTWHSGTAESIGNLPNHGASSTATSIFYNSGNFGPGRVESWQRVTTMRVGMKGAFSLETDDTRQYLINGGLNVQWLERAGYAYTLSPDSSLAFGVRHIVGTAPEIVSTQPMYCTTYLVSPPTGTRCTGAWNLSFAYHKRTPHEEYFFAYGDASQQSTVPQWIGKWIHYFGAEKGT